MEPRNAPNARNGNNDTTKGQEACPYFPDRSPRRNRPDGKSSRRAGLPAGRTGSWRRTREGTRKTWGSIEPQRAQSTHRERRTRRVPREGGPSEARSSRPRPCRTRPGSVGRNVSSITRAVFFRIARVLARVGSTPPSRAAAADRSPGASAPGPGKDDKGRPQAPRGATGTGVCRASLQPRSGLGAGGAEPASAIPGADAPRLRAFAAARLGKPARVGAPWRRGYGSLWAMRSQGALTPAVRLDS